MTLIYHAFAGSCVESEVLADYGDVVGLGIEPTPHSGRNTEAFVQCDLSSGEAPVDRKADFALIQPPCGHASPATPPEHRAHHPELIDEALELAESIAYFWAVENVLTSTLALESNLRLRGDMFDLPIKFERIFATNYRVDQPEGDRYHGGYTHVNRLRKAEAAEIKGYSTEYHVHDLVMNSLPAAYVRHLVEACPGVGIDGVRPLSTY